MRKRNIVTKRGTISGPGIAETHIKPEESCSDADCQIHVNRIKKLIEHQEAILDINLKYKSIHKNNLGD